MSTPRIKPSTFRTGEPMRYILALLFLASSAFAQDVTYPYSSSSGSSGSGIVVGQNTFTNGSGTAIDAHGSTVGTNGGPVVVSVQHYNAGSARNIVVSNNTAGAYIEFYTSGTLDAQWTSSGISLFGDSISATSGSFSNLTIAGTPVTAIQIVTNTDIRAIAPTQQRQMVYDTGSNTLFFAEGLTTNDWIKFVGAAVP